MLAPSLLLALPLLAAAAPVLNGSMAPPPPVGGVDTSALLLRPSPSVVTQQQLILPPSPVSDATAPAPIYAPADDFDFQSLALALHQEWIECVPSRSCLPSPGHSTDFPPSYTLRLDLFEYGLERFSDEEFDEYGINAEQRSLIKFMAQQEVRPPCWFTICIVPPSLTARRLSHSDRPRHPHLEHAQLGREHDWRARALHVPVRL
jgi:hypothetical protein